jgi:hypothetical protein
MNASDLGSFWVISLLYIALGVLFYFPASFIYKFGARIRKYQFSNSEEDLEQAFKNNKSYWKFYGVLCIIYLAFIPVLVIVSIIAGIAAVSGFF